MVAAASRCGNTNHASSIEDNKRNGDARSRDRAEVASGGTRDHAPVLIAPLVHCLGSEYPERRARDEMALEIEGVVDGSVDAEKPLCGASRPEPHFGFAPSHERHATGMRLPAIRTT